VGEQPPPDTQSMQQTNPKQIALFGGAFDPPHVGHAAAIRRIVQSARFDEIWVVPTSIRPDKHSVASDTDRKAMCKLLLEHFFSVEDPEQGRRAERSIHLATHLLDRPGQYPTTFDELVYLRDTYPSVAFTVAIGSDEAAILNRWHRVKELMRTTPFFVFPRPEHISSTRARELLAQEASVAHLVPEPIVRYIQNHHLYRKEAAHGQH